MRKKNTYFFNLFTKLFLQNGRDAKTIQNKKPIVSYLIYAQKNLKVKLAFKNL